jgi:GT2 family glycosyltransferase
MIVSDSPVLSVIVVNYFSEESLARCLRSIAGTGEPVEVIVADNGSHRERQQALRASHPALVWLAMGRNAGFGAASNAGAARAQSEKLLFLNPDTAVAPGSLAALAEALETRELAGAILGCSIFDPDGAVQLSCRRFPSWKTFVSGRFSLLTRLFPSNGWSADYLMRDFDHRERRPVDWVSGAAMAMRRQTFERLGGFDENYFLYFEDVDLCRRAWREAIPVVYFPEARVEHLIGASSRRTPYRALAHRHRSMWLYYRRYHGRLWLDPLAWLGIFGRLAALCALKALSGLAPAPPAIRPAEDRRLG